MYFMQFCNQKGIFSTLNLRFAYFVRSKMSKGYQYVPKHKQYKIKKRKMDNTWFWNKVFTYLFTTVSSDGSDIWSPIKPDLISNNFENAPENFKMQKRVPQHLLCCSNKAVRLNYGDWSTEPSSTVSLVK